MDSTGYECRHVSRHYAHRTGQKPYLMRRFAKLSVALLVRSHLFVSFQITKGPTHDVCEAPEVLRDAHRRVRFATSLLDMGYDSERLLRLIYEELHATAVVPARRNYRNPRRWPKTRYRRRMWRSFDVEAYRQRPQVESVFSRCKRKMGSALSAKTWAGQQREVALRVLTHNLAVLRRRSSFRQSLLIGVYPWITAVAFLCATASLGESRQ